MRKALIALFTATVFTSSAAVAALQVTIDFNDPIWGTGSSKIDPILATIHFPNKANRDRKPPHGASLPHHRTYGSRIRRFNE